MTEIENILAKARRVGITRSLTRKDNEDLYQKVLQGNQEAIKQMIEGNMALVIVRLESFLNEYPQYEFFRDDLISEGFLALSQAVNRMAVSDEHPDANPSGYIYTAIDNSFMAAALEEEAMFGSNWTIRNNAKIGKKNLKRVAFKVVDDITYDPCRYIDLRQEIRDLARTPEEKQFIALAEQNFSFKEIAVKLGIRRDKVYEIQDRLHARYKMENK